MKRNKFLINIFCFIIIFLVNNESGFAQKRSRKKLEKQKIETLKKIKQAEKILKETEKKKKANLGQLSALNNLITSRNSLIIDLQSEVKLFDDELMELTDFQNVMTNDLEHLKKEYAAMLYTSSKTANSYNKLLFLFSANTFNQFLRRFKYLEQYGEARINQVKQIKIVKDNLEKKKEEVKEKREEKNDILSLQLEENRKLTGLKTKHYKVLGTLKGKEKELKRELVVQRKSSKKLDKMITDIVRAEIAKASSGSGKGDMSVASSSFMGSKSRMLWPVPGFISSKFGKHAHRTLKGIYVDNYGVGIQTNKDQKVKSVYDGKVLRVALVPGSGTAVIVKHGQYFTVYSKMKNVKVKTGQAIKRGEVIGEVYTDNSGVSELEFQVWKNSVKLNPEVWLKKG